jgi:hypothetical protein
LNVIQKPLFGLKNVLQNFKKHFKTFGSGFTEIHAKFDAETLLDFALHPKENKTLEIALV